MVAWECSLPFSVSWSATSYLIERTRIRILPNSIQFFGPWPSLQLPITPFPTNLYLKQILLLRALFLLWPSSIICTIPPPFLVSHNLSFPINFLICITFLPALWLISPFRFLLPLAWPIFNPVHLQSNLNSCLHSPLWNSLLRVLSEIFSYLRTFTGSSFSTKSWLSCLSYHWPALPTTNMTGAFLHLIKITPSLECFHILAYLNTIYPGEPQRYLGKELSR